jgi:HEAT repeat protein
LGRMGAEAEAAVPALLQSALDDQDPLVRAISISSLRQILGKSSDKSRMQAAGFVLIKALKDRDPMVREAAAYSLVADEFVPDRSLIIPALLVSAHDRDERVRSSAVSTLAWISPTEGDDFIAVRSAVFKAMQDKNTRARECSLSDFRILAKRSPTIVGTALADDAVQVRRGALEALRRHGHLSGISPRTVAPTLITSLQDPDERVRLEAVNVLSASLTWPQERPAVPNASATRLRQNGAVGRGWSEASPDLPKALAAMLDDSCVDVRRAAASALGRFGASAAGALAALDSALGDTDPTVRRVAAESNRVIKAHSAEVASAIEGWLGDLTSGDAAVRYSATEALGLMGPPAVLAVPALTRLLNDADEVVRGAAHTALRNIGTNGSTRTEGIRSRSATP